ncbi:hypothetical protein fgpv_258 [Flamingopox virus FGPVKD09]|uniref:Uncharacterized protein n=1 Tax=Flamingopox virus FGPVKD09 TaxID=2059380 RepID=A0A2H4X2Q2_9POXV|nr:hypothetical protein C1178_gp258 [Flamingopox virus FGPVKD09]AUD40346.1 hypothetical protein fgpv_258 [Flamingopox virus FGPVKD09]
MSGGGGGLTEKIITSTDSAIIILPHGINIHHIVLLRHESSSSIFEYTLLRFIKPKNTFKLLTIKLKKQITIYRGVVKHLIIPWIVQSF